jgi:hypothetical protein
MLPDKVTKKQISSLKPLWVRDAMEGYRMMRAGKDYVNNDNRYAVAYDLLKSAFFIAKKDKSATTMDMARICLWAGITLNENWDINPPTTRNDRALEWYKKGLRYARVSLSKNEDPMASLILASLYNSRGVAHHHRYIKEGVWPDIPKAAYNAYCKSREIILEHDGDQKFNAIMKKIESNTGRTVTRTSASRCTNGGSNDRLWMTMGGGNVPT